jgi:hypothetical protein
MKESTINLLQVEEHFNENEIDFVKSIHFHIGHSTRCSMISDQIVKYLEIHSTLQKAKVQSIIAVIELDDEKLAGYFLKDFEGANSKDKKKYKSTRKSIERTMKKVIQTISHNYGDKIIIGAEELSINYNNKNQNEKNQLQHNTISDSNEQDSNKIVATTSSQQKDLHQEVNSNYLISEQRALQTPDQLVQPCKITDYQIKWGTIYIFGGPNMKIVKIGATKTDWKTHFIPYKRLVGSKFFCSRFRVPLELLFAFAKIIQIILSEYADEGGDDLFNIEENYEPSTSELWNHYEDVISEVIHGKFLERFSEKFSNISANGQNQLEEINEVIIII